MKRQVLVLILCWPMVATGQLTFDTSTGLMELCNGSDPDTANARDFYCTGFFVGFSETTFVLEAIHSFKDVCMPSKGVTPRQLRQVFLNYMREHPEDWHLMAGSLALNAYLEAWPCKE